MKIGDKAEKAQQGGDSVYLASDSNGVYRLESDEVVEADEIGTDEFPKYGDFIRVKESYGGDPPSWDETAFLELTSALAIELNDTIDVGDAFRIRRPPHKDENGEWTGYDLEEVEEQIDG
jgi:hypothetical protein